MDLWVEPPPLTDYGSLTTPVQLELAKHLGARILAPDLPVFRERLEHYAKAAFYAPDSAGMFGEALGEALSRPMDSEEPAHWDRTPWAQQFEAALTGAPAA
jgi:hypothetical protein